MLLYCAAFAGTKGDRGKAELVNEFERVRDISAKVQWKGQKWLKLKNVRYPFNFPAIKRDMINKGGEMNGKESLAGKVASH